MSCCMIYNSFLKNSLFANDEERKQSYRDACILLRQEYKDAHKQQILQLR